MGETLKRVLNLLYEDWFRYEDLCPRAMWLVELPYAQSGYFLNLNLWPQRVYFLEHIGMQQKSALDWRRFYLMQWGHSWHSGAEYPVRDAPWPEFFDVGLARFAVNPGNQHLIVELTFGPRYGRGYELTPTGEHLPGWVS